MKIVVEMTEREFLEFMDWKQDQEKYERKAASIKSTFEYVCNKILWALDDDAKKPGKVKIIDQEHAAELVEQAREHFR